MLSFECIKNEKSVYFLLTSATRLFLGIFMAIMSYAAQSMTDMSKNKRLPAHLSGQLLMNNT